MLLWRSSHVQPLKIRGIERFEGTPVTVHTSWMTCKTESHGIHTCLPESLCHAILPRISWHRRYSHSSPWYCHAHDTAIKIVWHETNTYTGPFRDNDASSGLLRSWNPKDQSKNSAFHYKLSFCLSFTFKWCLSQDRQGTNANFRPFSSIFTAAAVTGPHWQKNSMSFASSQSCG